MLFRREVKEKEESYHFLSKSFHFRRYFINNKTKGVDSFSIQVAHRLRSMRPRKRDLGFFQVSCAFF